MQEDDAVGPVEAAPAKELASATGEGTVNVQDVANADNGADHGADVPSPQEWQGNRGSGVGVHEQASTQSDEARDTKMPSQQELDDASDATAAHTIAPAPALSITDRITKLVCSETALPADDKQVIAVVRDLDALVDEEELTALEGLPSGVWTAFVDKSDGGVSLVKRVVRARVRGAIPVLKDEQVEALVGSLEDDDVRKLAARPERAVEAVRAALAPCAQVIADLNTRPLLTHAFCLPLSRPPCTGIPVGRKARGGRTRYRPSGQVVDAAQARRATASARVRGANRQRSR